MTKKKLERFAEIEKFSNVLQPSFNDVFKKDYPIKGNWRRYFFKNDAPVVLELGCGKGEYTIELAKKYPNINYLGVDIKGARIWRGAKTALDEKLKNVGFLRTRIEVIDSFFYQDEINEIWVTFPDPQPKKSRKRLTSSIFLNKYKAFLKPDGPIHLKTDNKELYNYTLSLAKFNDLRIDFATDNLYSSQRINHSTSIKTYYEKKFLDQGLEICYLKFQLFSNRQIEELPDDE